MIRALVFDFDGLILDTEVPEFQAWQEVFRDHGCELPLSTWAGYIGSASHHFDPCSLLESQLGKSIDRDTVKGKRRQRNRELLSTQEILPGVENYLTTAQRLNLKIGLASSSPFKVQSKSSKPFINRSMGRRRFYLQIHYVKLFRADCVLTPWDDSFSNE